MRRAMERRLGTPESSGRWTGDHRSRAAGQGRGHRRLLEGRWGINEPRHAPVDDDEDLIVVQTLPSRRAEVLGDDVGPHDETVTATGLTKDCEIHGRNVCRAAVNPARIVGRGRVGTAIRCQSFPDLTARRASPSTLKLVGRGRDVPNLGG